MGEGSSHRHTRSDRRREESEAEEDRRLQAVVAGITDKSAHGLRKLAATIWAERGATEHELMAMFGWLTPAMAALYTRAARRKLLSLNAHDRLSGTPAERPVPAPDYEVRALG